GNFLAGLTWGGTLYLLKQFDPKRCLEIIEKERINYMGGAVIMYEGMAAQPEFEDADMSSFFAPLVGASPVPLPLLKRWQKKGVNLRQGYGLTEASSIIISLPHWASESKLSAIGFHGYSAEFRVVDAEGNDSPPGEPGEILIRGPVVMLGYWNNPKATEETIIDGWLHTGDVGLKDEDGFISIVDRVKDMIISGGINTYPAEIEKCIFEIEGVLEAAVIGIPDEKWGETVGALIRSSRDMTVQDVIDHCKAHLADYKVPRYVKLIGDPLPRTMSGKLVKRNIKKKYLDILLESGRAR
ncbi:MAG: AMP-binding protein, partial [Desulfatitalea sp.]|nr:AMP-binding protein [Desulfatitalea sp.]NNK02220.1 AMP-binding protein [Desulfatitalea sp.]